MLDVIRYRIAKNQKEEIKIEKSKDLSPLTQAESTDDEEIESSLGADPISASSTLDIPSSTKMVRSRKEFTIAELKLVEKYLGARYIRSNDSILKHEVETYIKSIPETKDLFKKFGLTSLITKIRTERKRFDS